MSVERRRKAHTYGYTPRRSEARPSQVSSGSAFRKLVLFTAVTGITLFGAAEATGVFHIEDVPARVLRGINSINLPQEADYMGRGKLFDKPIEPGVRKQFLTEGFAQVEIPVREKPGPGEDQVGITLGGYLVNGEERYGDTYPSNFTVGEFEGPDGLYYGAWFRVDAVPLFARTESGEYVPIGEARGAYIAQNFLTLPTEETGE